VIHEALPATKSPPRIRINTTPSDPEELISQPLLKFNCGVSTPNVLHAMAPAKLQVDMMQTVAAQLAGRDSHSPFQVTCGTSTRSQKVTQTINAHQTATLLLAVWRAPGAPQNASAAKQAYEPQCCHKILRRRLGNAPAFLHYANCSSNQQECHHTAVQ
jgi:hypothetical protein